MEQYDTRKALERAMRQCAELEKETERIDDRRYRITLHYRQGDETEILIRVLSFGPVLKVIEPESIVAQLRERLTKQMVLMAEE